MLEVNVEKAHCKKVKANGGIPYKFVSPGRRGVPDRLDLYKIPKEHRAIVALYVCFTELKKTGKKPRPEQTREHNRLKRLGFRVEVIDNV